MDNFELLIWSSCQATFEYVFAVKAKYLQMLVAYSIFKEDPDQVADHEIQAMLPTLRCKDDLLLDVLALL